MMLKFTSEGTSVTPRPRNRKRVLAAAGRFTGVALRTFEGHPAGVRSVAISADGCHVLAGSCDGTVRVWDLDWDHDFPPPAAWDEGARPYLTAFLARHAGRPWTEADLAWLTGTLREVGNGWLEKSGVRTELARMCGARDDEPRAGVRGQGGRSA